MDGLPWYKTFFGADYLQMYTFLTPERTEREVEGIVTLLNLPAGSALLDLCCGHGRHTIALAARGYQVSGLDLSAVFLQHARDKATRQGVQVRWVESDMRQIPFEHEFEAIINIFTAFGYLESEEEDQRSACCSRSSGSSNPAASSYWRQCTGSGWCDTLNPAGSAGIPMACWCWRSAPLIY